MRVAAFVSGGALPEPMRGGRTNAMIPLADWYATFCGLAGVSASDVKAVAAGLGDVDSVDQWPVLSGQVNHSVRTEYWASSNAPRVLLQAEASPVGPTIYKLIEQGNAQQLFELISDPSETTNLVTIEPTRFKSMHERHDQLLTLALDTSPDLVKSDQSKCMSATTKSNNVLTPMDWYDKTVTASVLDAVPPDPPPNPSPSRPPPSPAPSPPPSPAPSPPWSTHVGTAASITLWMEGNLEPSRSYEVLAIAALLMVVMTSMCRFVGLFCRNRRFRRMVEDESLAGAEVVGNSVQRLDQEDFRDRAAS